MIQDRRIGPLDVTVVGLGCNNFGTRLDEQGTARVVHAALDAGINFFDTADIYGAGRSEEFLGRALGARRPEVIIATKFGKPMGERERGARPEYIRQAAEASLRRLGTEVIDLYQIHEPDPSVPIEDTLGALNELVRAGKVRAIGCSNFSAVQIRDAESAAAKGDCPRFVSVQNEYSLLHREPEHDGVLETCRRLGLAFLPYFPLASGLLSGKYHRGQPAPEGSRLAGGGRAGSVNDENLARVEALRAFAKDRGHTLLELAFSWLLAHPSVSSVIAGATKVEQVKSNASAAAWMLNDVEVAQVNALT